MMPPADQKNQTPFDDEISINEIIHFVKSNLKSLIIFIITSCVLSVLIHQLKPQKYTGLIIIEPAKFDNKYIMKKENLIGLIKFQSFFSLNTLKICDINEIDNISEKLKPYLYEDFIAVEYNNNINRSTIENCLNKIEDEIRFFQFNEFNMQEKAREAKVDKLKKIIIQNPNSARDPLNIYKPFLEIELANIEELNTPVNKNNAHKIYDILIIKDGTFSFVRSAGLGIAIGIFLWLTHIIFFQLKSNKHILR